MLSMIGRDEDGLFDLFITNAKGLRSPHSMEASSGSLSLPFPRPLTISDSEILGSTWTPRGKVNAHIPKVSGNLKMCTELNVLLLK